MSTRHWSFGDKVVLRQRPEWGTGIVTSAHKAEHNGTGCQRVTIRFERAGLKTLSTGVAELCDAVETAVLEKPTEAGGWLTSLEGARPEDVMTQLPERVRDPFRSLPDRLDDTVKLFRFDESASSLLDWAAAQSGMSDPLSRFNRHELEALFRRYAMARAEHLKSLALELKRQDPALLATLASSMPSDAQQALKRANIIR